VLLPWRPPTRRADVASELCSYAPRLAGVREAVQLSDRIIILEFGGETFADIEVGLSYPRLQSDQAVSTMSEILAVFEEMQSRRASGDPRIAARAEGVVHGVIEPQCRSWRVSPIPPP
jgi:hypothetical protein